MAVIKATDLQVNFGIKPILHGLTIRVEKGTKVGLIGPNGSGKTTLLRTIAGLIPYLGSLRVMGKEVSQWKARLLAQQMAFLRQTTPIAFDFTVRDLVMLGRGPHKRILEWNTTQDQDTVDHALTAVDLSGFGGRSTRSLSGGELRRAFLAQALVQEATILLLDEPTAHLDVHHQYRLLSIVDNLVAQGRTILVVFHDIELAARYSDIIYVVQHGRIFASGPPDTLLTPELMASVFRMECTVTLPDQIHYHAPIT